MVFDADVHGRRQRDDGRLLRQHGEHSPDRVPDGDDGRADPFPDGDGGSDRRTLARRDDRGDDARAGRPTGREDRAGRAADQRDRRGAGRREQRPRAGCRQV